jgi:formate C-acetyltransferase
VSRIDFTETSGGVSYIVDVHPCIASTPQALDALAAALRTFFSEGGMEIGLNVLREEELRAAQRNPEEYGHLMVRVFGFSSQFVSLSPALQDYVIANSRHQR